MSNMKKYLITAMTLGIIAMSAGALIGATNLITKDSIAKNEQEKINKSFRTIFDDDNAYSSKDEDCEIETVKHIYYISALDTPIGYALRTTDSNSYGKISLIVGFDKAGTFKDIYVITNEQTSTDLQDFYIAEINKNHSYIDVSVSCGATFGAKTTRGMIDDAKQVVDSLVEKDK